MSPIDFSKVPGIDDPHLDERSFLALVERLHAERADEITTPEGLEPLRPGDMIEQPAPGTAEHREALALGEQAFREGRIAAAVVAGGAGTRFGGAVKGLVPVLNGRTFLELKLDDARRVGQRHGKPVPVAMMTSALTHDGIREFLGSHGLAGEVLLFRQRGLPRLTLDWKLYRDAQGELSVAPAGHGDFFRALRVSGVGDELRRRGVQHLLFSNVDNLAGTLDPLTVGLHLKHGGSMTMECAPRKNRDGELDPGGSPVRVKGELMMVEKVDSTQHPWISTNTMYFQLDAILDREIPLPYRVVRKSVENAQVLQIEQVTGEASGLLDRDGKPLLAVRFMQVPRVDPRTTRFEPVKTQKDLARVAAILAQRLPT